MGCQAQRNHCPLDCKKILYTSSHSQEKKAIFLFFFQPFLSSPERYNRGCGEKGASTKKMKYNRKYLF
jgi:hypothetical protein